MKIELSDKELSFLMRVLVQNHAEDVGDFDDPDQQDIGASGTSSFLIGKIVSAINSHESFYQARKQRHLKEPVCEKLFMGAGYHSLVVVNKLHRRLAFALAN
jgi:hypothetical protein